MRSNKDNISITVLAVDICRKESKYIEIELLKDFTSCHNF